MRWKRFLLTLACVASASVMPIAIATTVAIYTTEEANYKGSYGEVYLRSYFERGSGSANDPFVITRPRHMYNLSRLQGFGVFNTQYHFELGSTGLDGSPDLCCWSGDGFDAVPVPYLDMSESTYFHQPINVIGSEATPFYGEFDGQSLEIKNLTVYGDGQDSGLFGYTAHDSNIHDLYLSDVTINTLGYTDSYSGLLTPGNSAASVAGTSFTYTRDTAPTDQFTPGSEYADNITYPWNTYLTWAESLPDIDSIDTAAGNPAASLVGPNITVPVFDNGYDYKLLCSGDFATLVGKTEAQVDMKSVLRFFYLAYVDQNQRTLPISAYSSVSLIATIPNEYGLERSRVVMTLQIDCSITADDPNNLHMEVHLAKDHGNNIGVFIGHCDGTAKNLYCYNARFVMNCGKTYSPQQNFNMVENQSRIGLIGLVGGTVHNVIAEEADAGASKGTDVGTLDFSSLYKAVIADDSFANSTAVGNGVTYVPRANNNYSSYLRKDNNGNYVTKARNTLSFNGQKVIRSSETGVFTIATDSHNDGMGSYAGDQYVGASMVQKVKEENDKGVSIDGKYYVYYAMGEFDKSRVGNKSFSEWTSSLLADRPTEFFTAHYFPHRNEVSAEGFAQRELHQNYIIRVKLNPDTRKGFYFSDVDRNTDAGYFMSEYFYYKLRDSTNQQITRKTAKAGIALTNASQAQVREFTANFPTPDFSLPNAKMWCFNNAAKPVSNMINFEITTPQANVTVVAGQKDGLPAALGIYKIDSGDFGEEDEQPYFNQGYDNPDYAFFMPREDKLAYFDYQSEIVNNKSVGHIGKYTYDASSQTPFTFNKNLNTSHDAAFMPKEGKENERDPEFGYVAGKTRLYAHTFLLPEGKYCIGSATGSNDTGFGPCDIYYVSAQGQDEGESTYDTTVVASSDTVEKVDFLKQPRFAVGSPYTANIITEDEAKAQHLPDVTQYSSNSNRLENNRCYVELTNNNVSTFADKTCDIAFIYDDSSGYFVIKTIGDPENDNDDNSDLSGMTHVVVSNYGKSYGTAKGISDLENLGIVLFDKAVDNGDTIIYDYVEQP